MKVDLFIYKPKSGDYGSDWVYYCTVNDVEKGRRIAGVLVEQGEYVRIFSFSRTGIGRMLIELGNNNMIG